MASARMFRPWSVSSVFAHQVSEQDPVTDNLDTFPDPKDVSSLLQRAGFTMLTVDVEEIMMGYPSMWELMQDLKDMGEGNAIFGRCVLRCA